MHESVLLQEVIKGLNLKRGFVVVDGTLGNGGHALKICEIIGEKGVLIGIDEDETALKEAERRLKSFPTEKHFVQGNFRNLKEILTKLSFNTIDALVLDLGLRTEQIEQSGRGFSFRKDEPLLMTFTKDFPTGALTAYEIVNRWGKKDLVQIFKEYGEEPFASKIADTILATRKEHPLDTTKDLQELILKSVPAGPRRGGGHRATRVFQALRIAVNDELSALEALLEQVPEILKPHGRVAVISFHSLEDRIVKQTFKKWVENGTYTHIHKKPITPSAYEREHNPKSRSAKLRIIEKNEIH
ncbi:MAG: 16S rRNA (cytosine(1402)-N(4))-methyltransferase RsmH [Candidatus Paceibacterota bacterium]